MKFLQGFSRIMLKPVGKFSIRRHIGGGVTRKGSKLSARLKPTFLMSLTGTGKFPKRKTWCEIRLVEFRRRFKKIAENTYVLLYTSPNATHGYFICSAFLFRRRQFVRQRLQIQNAQSLLYIFFVRLFSRKGAIRTRSFFGGKRGRTLSGCTRIVGNWIFP